MIKPLDYVEDERWVAVEKRLIEKLTAQVEVAFELEPWSDIVNSGTKNDLMLSLSLDRQ